MPKKTAFMYRLGQDCQGPSRHKFNSLDDLTSQGRCRECERENKSTRRRRERAILHNGVINVGAHPSIVANGAVKCRKGKHDLKSNDDVDVPGTLKCKHCRRERHKGYKDKPAKSSTYEKINTPQDGGLYMEKLQGVRQSLERSSHELASLCRIPHDQYLLLEELRAKADEETQRKLVNGVWLARRQYQRDVAGVAI